MLDAHTGGECSRHIQSDIQTCPHCETVIQLQQGEYGWCRCCKKPVCVPWAHRMLTYGCEPLIKRLEQILGIESKLAQFRKLAGLEPEPQKPALIVSGSTKV